MMFWLAAITLLILFIGLLCLRLSRVHAECALLSACVADMLEKPEEMGRIARKTHDEIMRLRGK